MNYLNITSMHLIFYAFAAVAVAASVMVITTRHPVRSVLALVVAFFAMSGVWMLMQAEFLSLILLLVYVGAVMTLFLFVVMMLNVNIENKRSGFVRYLPFGILIALILTGLLLLSIGFDRLGLVNKPEPVLSDVSNIKQLGLVLYTNYVYPFELAGVILLAAMIAAITLTHRGPMQRKVQNPKDQIAVKRDERVRLVKGMEK